LGRTVELDAFYTTLLAFRKKNKALQESASVVVLPSHHPDVLVYLCRRQHHRVLVLLNFSKEKADFHVDHPAVAGQYHNLFTGETVTIGRKENFHLSRENIRSMTLLPESFCI